MSDIVKSEIDGIDGIAVLRYPAGKFIQVGDRMVSAGWYARHIVGQLQKGSVIALPNTRDEHGEYEWDFRIEGSTTDGVSVLRNGVGTVSTPIPRPAFAMPDDDGWRDEA